MQPRKDKRTGRSRVQPAARARTVLKPRTTSFDRALVDAEKRLAKAEAERDKATLRVADLNAEIPRLRQIIASLSGKEPEARLIPETGRTPDPALASIPEHLRKFVGPQDLTGMGSIPAQHPPSPMKVETEDDTLPPIDGEPLSE